MASSKLDHSQIAFVLHKVNESELNDEFSAANDKIIQMFVDYQWNRNKNGVYIA